jgi:hypothetical protein
MGPYIAILCLIVGGILGYFIFRGQWDDAEQGKRHGKNSR